MDARAPDAARRTTPPLLPLPLLTSSPSPYPHGHRKQEYLGLFDDKEEALQTVLKAKKTGKVPERETTSKTTKTSKYKGVSWNA